MNIIIITLISCIYRMFFIHFIDSHFINIYYVKIKSSCIYFIIILSYQFCH